MAKKEKCFLEADWLKTKADISGVPVLHCPSSPPPPLQLIFIGKTRLACI